MVSPTFPHHNPSPTTHPSSMPPRVLVLEKNTLLEHLRTLIRSTPLLVFTMPGCPCCIDLTSRLADTPQSSSVRYVYVTVQLKVDLTLPVPVVDRKKTGPADRGLPRVDANGSDIRRALRTITPDHSTMPSVFVHGRHIGGCSDVIRLMKRGEWEGMLAAGKEVPVDKTGNLEQTDSTEHPMNPVAKKKPSNTRRSRQPTRWRRCHRRTTGSTRRNLRRHSRARQQRHRTRTLV